MRDPDEKHPIDELLRHAAGDPTPTAADRAHAERALNRAIEGAGRTRVHTIRAKGRQWQQWTVPALAGSLAVILVAVILLQVGQPSPAAAALGEIATLVELVDPITIPDQSFVYTKSRSTVRAFIQADGIKGRDTPLTYLLPKTREVWVGRDGTLQLRITAHTPIFFSATDEADYFAEGLDEADRIGETVTQTAVGVVSILDWLEWPTTPEELEAAIVESLIGDAEEPRNVLVAERALELIIETTATPELRTAALRVISNLSGVDLDKRRPDGGGTFSITYDQPRPTRMAVTIDGRGNVVRFTRIDLAGDPAGGVPPGALLVDTILEPARIVGSLDVP